jgi:hypothetical protein
MIVAHLIKKRTFLWNTKVYYFVHNSSPLACVLSEMSTVLTHALCFCSIHLILRVCLHRGLPSGIFLSSFLTKIMYALLIYMHAACPIPHPLHPLWFDLTNNNWWRVQLMKMIIIMSQSSTLKMETACLPETLASTWCQNPDNHHHLTWKPQILQIVNFLMQFHPSPLFHIFFSVLCSQTLSVCVTGLVNVL